MAGIETRWRRGPSIECVLCALSMRSIIVGEMSTGRNRHWRKKGFLFFAVTSSRIFLAVYPFAKMVS